MVEIKYKHDLLAPEHTKTFEFSVSEPTKVFKLVPQTMKDIFRIPPPGFFEDQIKWDVSADPIAFFGAWRCKDSKDNRTTVWISIKVQGTQSQKDKTGSATLRITGFIETNFSYSNPILRGVIWLYMYIYYKNQIRVYIAEARKRLEQLEDELRKEFEIVGR